MPAVPMGVVFQPFSCSQVGQPEGLSYAPEVQETWIGTRTSSVPCSSPISSLFYFFLIIHKLLKIIQQYWEQQHRKFKTTFLAIRNI
jgi:hypothetical protein